MGGSLFVKVSFFRLLWYGPTFRKVRRMQTGYSNFIAFLEPGLKLRIAGQLYFRLCQKVLRNEGRVIVTAIRRSIL